MKPYTSGFTLIELLLFIVLSSTFIGFGIAGYKDFAVRQQIDAETRSVSSDLRYAESQANNGIKPAGCATLDGYRFRFVGTPITSYTISGICGANTYIIKTVAVPSNMNITANVLTVLFRTVGQGTDLASGTPMTVTVTGNTTFTQRSLTVQVTQTGEIK